ncbi:ABC-2 type transport system ATP-binding protein [Aurantimicrobium minutum]|uniref:ABC transporter ATP-binding protein n=1 Tax=Aurantimicrobium minutum TaxID=708131 RepID=UPI0024754A87|nr:ABC transporter ATP-binding protein [Aurantimicrobium minutum]MDH6277782.1 ABC-2 type transport system ATP-binding protein [Aurantimicrobium minutum]
MRIGSPVIPLSRISIDFRGSVDVSESEICAIIGGNGMGKSTLLRAVSGFLPVSSGIAEISGSLGFVDEALKGIESFTTFELLYNGGLLNGLEASEAKARARQLINYFGLESARDMPVVVLSSGTKKRVYFALAIAHRPANLLLDEPFESVDPIALEQMLNAVRSASVAGTRIIFTSHQLDLVESIATKVICLTKDSKRATVQITPWNHVGKLKEWFTELTAHNSNEVETIW